MKLEQSSKSAKKKAIQSINMLLQFTNYNASKMPQIIVLMVLELWLDFGYYLGNTYPLHFE